MPAASWHWGLGGCRIEEPRKARTRGWAERSGRHPRTSKEEASFREVHRAGRARQKPQRRKQCSLSGQQVKGESWEASPANGLTVSRKAAWKRWVLEQASKDEQGLHGHRGREPVSSPIRSHIYIQNAY